MTIVTNTCKSGGVAAKTNRRTLVDNRTAASGGVGGEWLAARVARLPAALLKKVEEDCSVSRATLLPVAPVLTRYAESVNPFAKRKLIEPAVREEKVANKLNNLTVPKLCVKLNTLQNQSFCFVLNMGYSIMENIINTKVLGQFRRAVLPTEPGAPVERGHRGLVSYMEDTHECHWDWDDMVTRISKYVINGFTTPHLSHNCYIRDQLDTIEEGIKQSWVDVQSGTVGLLDYLSCMTSEGATSKSSPSDESIDELFTIFDDVRRTAVNITDTILNFIALLTDERHMLQVLDQEGFIWVLLDGGPSRAFLETDVNLMKDDLAMLKVKKTRLKHLYIVHTDLFIAEGQGLPSDVIEKEAKLAQQILDLYVLKADTIIDLLMKASEHMSHHLEPATARRRNVHDVHTLLRVLCHKKDNGASTFLKIQYHLPRSSDYDDVPVKDAPSKLKEMKICPRKEEKHHRISVLKIMFLFSVFQGLSSENTCYVSVLSQCNFHVEIIAATCGDVILPPQLD
uniref:Uncharacterized protein n=1 Tax=Aegilops tauschii TaxID=37682 RepID=N1R1M5_AEGTA